MYHVEHYYTSLEALSARYKNTKRKYAFSENKIKNTTDFMVWKKATRQKLCEITGINRMITSELKAELIETDELPNESFRRLKYVIQTEPDVFMPFYLLQPKASVGKMPTIICPHGHSCGGKLATGGRTDIDSVDKITREQHYEYGVEYARRGFMVFCPDARGFGERRELAKQGDLPEQYMTCCCKELNQMAIPLGLTVTGMWVWDLMRLLDYIQTRDDCDILRVAVAGLSGGGQQSLWLSALDDRIKAVAVSGYFYGYHDALLVLNENCSCNYVPHLWETVDMGDLGALIAPRPLIIESGDIDPLNGGNIENVNEQFKTVRDSYALFGAENNCKQSICSGVHRWYGYDTYDFIANNL